MKKGLTLLELMMAVMMLGILAGVSVSVLRAVLLSWSGQEARAGLKISLYRGIEEAARDLRAAREVQSANNEIRFTRDLTDYYIYYLYNADDPYPPGFNQDTYELRKAVLSGGMSGVFTYGSGEIKAVDVLPPPDSDLSLGANLITLDFTITAKDETMRLKTRVRPRNL